MTRINSAINVKRLTDEHLLAEHREIKRITDNFIKRKNSKQGLNNLPTKFTLGTGHVLFFIDKGGFTLNRYKQLYDECVDRGFNVTDYSNNWSIYGSNLKDYVPTDEEHSLLVERISERIMNNTKPNWHYRGRVVSKDEGVVLLIK